MQTAAWALFSKSTKQKKNLRSLLEVLAMSRAAMKPGKGRKMWATSRSVASPGTPNQGTVDVETGGRFFGHVEHLQTGLGLFGPLPEFGDEGVW